jgi:hypothetical protein
MKRDWSIEEVIEHFTLIPAEIEFLGSNNPHNQLGKAVLLKFFEGSICVSRSCQQESK